MKRNTDPAYHMFASAKVRARKAGLPFSITLQDVKDVWPADESCPVLGHPFGTRNGATQNYTSVASLDRLIPEFGYVPGNIAVISDRANRLKGNGTADEHRRLADWMKSHGLS